MNHSGIEIWQGNCFELMGKIADQSVDAIITDPPYGTTRLEWDQKIDLAAWWEAAGRVIKPSGVIAMFAAQPFATDLINSNRKWFRYELIWRKSRAVGFLDANKRPLRAHGRRRGGRAPRRAALRAESLLGAPAPDRPCGCVAEVAAEGGWRRRHADAT